jgi:hypothetical protein
MSKRNVFVARLRIIPGRRRVLNTVAGLAPRSRLGRRTAKPELDPADVTPNNTHLRAIPLPSAAPRPVAQCASTSPCADERGG